MSPTVGGDVEQLRAGRLLGSETELLNCTWRKSHLSPGPTCTLAATLAFTDQPDPVSRYPNCHKRLLRNATELRRRIPDPMLTRLLRDQLLTQVKLGLD